MMSASSLRVVAVDISSTEMQAGCSAHAGLCGCPNRQLGHVQATSICEVLHADRGAIQHFLCVFEADARITVDRARTRHLDALSQLPPTTSCQVQIWSTATRSMQTLRIAMCGLGAKMLPHSLTRQQRSGQRSLGNSTGARSRVAEGHKRWRARRSTERAATAKKTKNCRDVTSPGVALRAHWTMPACDSAVKNCWIRHGG
jgi:hypothetical protein